MTQTPKERALDTLEALARTGLLTLSHKDKDITVEHVSETGKHVKAKGESLAECVLAIARAISAKRSER